MDIPPVSPVETLIHYAFRDKHLLEEALRHSSFVNEVPDAGLRDNERLEFLGDAVLNLVVGHILLTRFSTLKEGDLSRMRANLVNEQQLAQLARGLCLGTAVKLGRGEAQSDGHEKNSILAGTLEALVAAVYVDGGFEAAFAIIQRTFLPSVPSSCAACSRGSGSRGVCSLPGAQVGDTARYLRLC